MSDRDALVAELARHNENGTDPDPALIDALAPRVDYDTEVAAVVGTAYWHRFLTLPGAASDEALSRALDAWTAVALVDPDALPDHVRTMMAASIDDPAVWFHRAQDVLAPAYDGDDHALVFAVRLLRRIIDEAGKDFTHRAAALAHLASALHAAGLRGGSPDFLDEALETSRRALAEEPEDSPTRPSLLGNHGTILFHHGDLDEAVQVLRDVWTSAPDDYPERSTFAYNLALALVERVERSGDLTDLDEAIDAAGAAMLHTAPGRPNHVPRARLLAELLAARDGEHNRLVELWDQIVAATPGDPDRAGYLDQLAGALRERYGHTRDLVDLDRAILAGQQAVEADPAPDSLRFNLGVALVQRFEHTGDHADLDRALDLLHDVYARTDQAHPNLSGRLSELAAALHVYFARTGDIADLDLAIELGERALAADQDHEAGYHAELSILLHERFDVTGGVPDLDAAIEHSRRAVALAPNDTRFALKLAYDLVTRARNGAPELLDEVFALLAGLQDPGARARLGLAHLTRFDLTGDREDLRSAADHYRACLRLRDPADVSRAREASALAFVLLELDPGLVTEARSAFRAAATTTGAEASVRLTAADNWHRLADDPRDAADALTVAVALLPELAGRRIAPHLRRARLDEIRGMASDAAALALHADDPRRAVTLLEDGRGVLLSHALETHADDEALHDAHPELGRRWRALRHQLDAEVDWATETGDSQRRRALVAERDALLGEIRAIPGFDRFLHSADLDDLRSSVDGGTVVVVNTSRYRSDAILLTADDLTTVALPTLTPEALAAQASLLHTAVTANDWTANDTLFDVLAWTWDAIVGPVLEHLGGTRVWWLPTGPAAALPLHAAGHYPGGPSTLDLLTSSYTPTARTLRHARSRSATTDPGEVLAVALRHTPDQASLPDAAEEAAEVARLWPSSTLLVDEEARRAALLTRLRAATRAHFACHAVSDPTDPANSHLLLHDGPLPVRDLIRLHLPAAELAYLSACSTADSGALPDEAIHISSALHIAGFRHVIGTLWPIADDVARRTAAHFYAALGDDPAAALTHASREIRAAYPANPLLWAAHIHVGP